jgi:predicted regulator of Ras-like GTPase activity (Roadblock/LC7/MglB family)
LNVPLAGATIVPGLKRGRVTMTWKQIRTLARPSSPPSPNDDLDLELPLKVLAPLFFAAQKNLVRPQPKPAVTADIPDLFFGFPQPAAAPAPPAMPPPTAPAPKPPDTNFYVWGENGEQPQSDEQTLNRPVTPATDFTSRLMHPKDVVARAVTLPGVAGALVALTDGLRVASEVPAELNADALSAFLPQIFERLNQSTRELRMGALNNVNFTVGNVPWKIFRVNSVYFAAFGRAGESLPAAPLAQLAGELDRKKKQ